MSKTRARRALNAVDLFSGCGGLTLGLKQAGFTVVGAVEIDALAAETYRENHPEVCLWQKDIRKLSGAELRRVLKLRKGQLDLLAGCPPCQGFSSMRTRNGSSRVRDDRNDLVFDYLRMVKAFRPKALLLENVPALAQNRRMSILVEKLSAMGYDCGGTPSVLDAADYGVPQRRRRMILVGSRKGAVSLPAGLRRSKTVHDAIGKMPKPGDSGDPLHDFPEKRDPRIVRLIKLVPKNGGSRADLPSRYLLPCHERLVGGFGDVYGRMNWKQVSPTITGGCFNPSKGRFLHPSQNRAITLREAALLQSFPRTYHFSLKRGKEAAALMIGNALPPTFVKLHARAIKSALQSRK